MDQTVAGEMGAKLEFYMAEVGTNIMVVEGRQTSALPII